MVRVRLAAALGAAWVVSVTGCAGGSEARNQQTGSVCAPGAAFAPNGQPCTTAQVPASGTAGTGNASMLPATAGSNATGIGQPTVSAAHTPLPCTVSSIVTNHCQMCHGGTPLYGAPMSLMSWENFMAPSKSDPSVPVYQKVVQRIQDPQKPMPQPPNPRLSADDVNTLVSWVNAGAAKGTDAACGMNTGTAGTGATGTAGSGATMMTGTAGTATMAADEECYELRANGGSPDMPYQVPFTPDYYRCFNFSPPWGNADVQATHAESIIDNAKVVHHWILYSSDTAQVDGTGEDCNGTHPGGQFIVGWAPGAKPMMMPPNVGLQLPGAGYQLEIHFNAPDAGELDRSGVHLCVTRNKRANTAAVHPLGRDLFSTSGPGDVVADCVPQGPFPITIMQSMPHMHLHGKHMKTVITRANGMVETLVDQAFDFQTQIAYDTPKMINAGDTLTTTCTYDAAVMSGTKTTQEMCYDFVMAYPAGSLAGGPGYTGLSGNGNVCIPATLQ